MKTTLINIIIILATIFVVDIALALILDWRSFINNKKSEKTFDTRALLPNYNNEEWPKIHFKEFENLDSKYKSFIGWRRNPFKGETITIDDNGIRISYVHEKLHEAHQKISVVLLGGSTVWGTGVRDFETISSYLNCLSEGDIKAVNLGESGFTAYQSYLLLQSYLLENEIPRVIISYQGVNDNPLFRSDKHSHIRENQIASLLSGVDRLERENNYEKLIPGFRDLALRINNKLLDSNKAVSRASEISKTISDTEAAVHLLESWVLTKRLADSINAKFICILQPNIYVGKPDITHLDNQVIEKNKQYEYYNSVISLLSTEKYKELKPHFFNFTEIFNNQPNLYIDFCHVSPLGNKIIAENIINILTEKSIIQSPIYN